MCLSPDEMRVFNKVIHSFISLHLFIVRRARGTGFGVEWYGAGGGGEEAKANALARDN